jgi:cytidylate kinase
MKPSPVVTIDGPAGSGKSTTAREVARRLGFNHLDSGALYRGLTLAAVDAGIPEDRWDDLDRETVARLDVSLASTGGGFRVLVNGVDPGNALRSPEVTRLASHLARNPRVRERLGELQRSARTFGGVVAEGRDMGTVVFPDAVLKVFLTASLEERSRRRLTQEGRPSDEASLATEGRAIRDRDESDESRAAGPLRRPDGALVIDTTSLSFEAQVQRIVEAATDLTTQSGEE